MSATFEPAAVVSSTAAAAIDAEFARQPGMRLTEAQARRLLSLQASDCRSALHRLVEAGRLVRDPRGQYAWTDGQPRLATSR